MKKAVKVMGMMVGAAVVGAIAGNLLGRAGVDTPVAVAVVLCMAMALFSSKRKVADQKMIEG